MSREEVVATLRMHESELRAAGVIALAVFGSVARGDERPNSDVDIVIRLRKDASERGFAYFGLLDALRSRLHDILGVPVDVVTEPVHKDKLRHVIERDQARAF